MPIPMYRYISSYYCTVLIKKIKTYDCIYHHYDVYIDAVYFQYAGWDNDVISTQWTHELPNHILRVKWAANNLIIRWIMRHILC